MLEHSDATTSSNFSRDCSENFARDYPRIITNLFVDFFNCYFSNTSQTFFQEKSWRLIPEFLKKFVYFSREPYNRSSYANIFGNFSCHFYTDSFKNSSTVFPNCCSKKFFIDQTKKCIKNSTGNSSLITFGNFSTYFYNFFSGITPPVLPNISRIE